MRRADATNRPVVTLIVQEKAAKLNNNKLPNIGDPPIAALTRAVKERLVAPAVA